MAMHDEVDAGSPCPFEGLVGIRQSHVIAVQVTSLMIVRFLDEVVIRFGIALPLTVNVPFATVAAAGVKADRDGSGDIAVSLLPARRVSYFIMWPHARPWRLARTEPMLRGLPDAVRASQILSRALAAAAAQTAPSLPDAATAGIEAVRATAVA